MKVLLACSHNSFMQWARHRCVGRLITPVLMQQELEHDYIAMDNFAFTGLDPVAFRQMLLAFSPSAESIKWVAVPDVVGDWAKTRRSFWGWSDRIRSLGYSLAYVLQDGQLPEEIPWSDISAVFLGGTTEYKLSEDALTLCRKAKQFRGKMVHIGRVNSVLRISRFVGIADSFDGMTFSRFPRTHLEQLTEIG